MEKARREGTTKATSSKAAGKQKQTDDDARDLESMLELINKASDRKLVGQSVILDGGLKSRMEKARMRDQAKVSIQIVFS
jgi:ubiquitin-protein ligase E3 D